MRTKVKLLWSALRANATQNDGTSCVGRADRHKAVASPPATSFKIENATGLSF